MQVIARKDKCVQSICNGAHALVSVIVACLGVIFPCKSLAICKHGFVHMIGWRSITNA